MSDTPVDGINFPTFAEQGYDKVVSTKKYEVKFPKGVDQGIVDKLPLPARRSSRATRLQRP